MIDFLVIILVLMLAATLAVYWRARQRIAQLQSSHVTIEDHQRTMAALQQTIADQKRAIDTLHDAQNAREQAAAALKATADAQLERLAALEADYARESRLLADTRAALEEREQHLAEAARQLEAARADRESKTALALTLANAAYDALLVLDADKRVLAVNDSATVLFARTHAPGESLVDVTQSLEIESMVDDALSYQEESFEEQVIINKRTYRVRAQVIPQNGKKLVALALMDITELVRLNRARRDMVANISHELRTPIANIRLIIDSIFHEQEKPKGKASRSALKAIARETDSLLWLVQELLDLSMIESGQAILRMVDVPAEDLVAEAVERLGDQSHSKHIRIASEVPAGIHVLCDRDQARRVLINLIHNAIKWSPREDTITVQVRPSGDEVRFAVLDNGPGVPDEYRERIFERFYQVDPSRSGGEGTGLGLAICKHIVEAHGGRIWAEGNSAGSGGRFLFTLPAATERIENTDRSEFA